jgi:hypothetical protein
MTKEKKAERDWFAINEPNCGFLRDSDKQVTLKDTVSELRKYIKELEAKLEIATKALENLKYREGCFCEVSIGNPMYSKHTSACINARKVLQELSTNCKQQQEEIVKC